MERGLSPKHSWQPPGGPVGARAPGSSSTSWTCCPRRVRDVLSFILAARIQGLEPRIDGRRHCSSFPSVLPALVREGTLREDKIHGTGFDMPESGAVPAGSLTEEESRLLLGAPTVERPAGSPGDRRMLEGPVRHGLGRVSELVSLKLSSSTSARRAPHRGQGDPSADPARRGGRAVGAAVPARGQGRDPARNARTTTFSRRGAATG